MKVLISGAGGMVGQAVQEYCRASGDLVFPYDHQSLDISDADRVHETLGRDQPEFIINCAAWTDVDGCELNRDRAFAANAEGPENLARASREISAGLITISTDYVFDGKKDGFYTQRDQPGPESIYGLSKLEGERRAQLAYARTIVVRTGFVFGPNGTNFLSTIIERASRGEKLKAIRDAYGTPSYAPDLARRLRELALMDLPGTFHVVNAGDGVSYEEFARAALDLSGHAATNLESVEMDSLDRPALRPRNSRLKCLLSDALGLAPLPSWKDSLSRFAALDLRSGVAAKG
ncbi:MAG TPA: dTDP-4-dehydrorhamnose reductase [Pyrinomonadaceae bacterium]|nr:dTDP-4-dehydrorhamnose reductase [Pyrinomonadaceae bacterium]